MSETSPNGHQHHNNGSAAVIEPAAEVLNIDSLMARISERLITLPAMNDAHARQAEQQEEAQYLIFRCGELTYGIEGAHVGEVVKQPQITVVPGLPDWVMGVTNLHGTILSVVDLGRFFEASSDQRPTMMFIAKAENQTIGLMVDAISKLDSFPVANIISPPFVVSAQMVAYLRGAVDHDNQIIRLLDCERLLLSPQMQIFS